MAPPTTYTYQPLPTASSIRILILQPAVQPSARLECRLETISLDGDARKCAVYDALSYAWGEDPRDRPLCCGPDGGTVFMAKNCEAALRRLRSRREFRSLWIDVVCINQRDDDERSAQVQQMGRIYASASRVLVYLGEHSNNSVVAMNYLRRRAVAGPYATKRPRDLSPGERKALLDLLARPWFNRVWVIQEVAMAQTVEALCGPHSVPWDTFWNLVCDMDIESAVSRLNPPYVLSIRMHSRSYQRALWQLLCRTRYCASTDPKDKYFALLSMTSSTGFPEIDYSQDVASLYTKLALYLLNTLKLDYLPAVQHCSKPNLDTSLDIPSWVPNWGQQIDLGEILYMNCPFGAGRSESSFVKVIPPGSDCNGVRTRSQLKVRGTRIRRIEGICPRESFQRHDPARSKQPYINALESFHGGASFCTVVKPGYRHSIRDCFPGVRLSPISMMDTAEALYRDARSGLRPLYMESTEICLVSPWESLHCNIN